MEDFDYLLEQAKLRRKQAMETQVQGFEMPQGRMVGGQYIPPSLSQALVQGLRQYGAYKDLGESDNQIKDITKQRADATNKAMSEFLRQSQGQSAITLPADQSGPTRPEIAPNLGAAYGALMQAPDENLRKFGMQGTISYAQAQEQERQKQAEALRKQQEEKRLLGVLQTAKTPQDARMLGVPSEMIESYYKLGDLGKQEVARTVEVVGPKGEKLIRSLDKHGNQVGVDVPAYIAPVQVNQGNRITFTTPTPGQTFTVGMTPGERDSSARGWTTINLKKQELSQSGGAKAPAGYRFKADGTLEAIPGGPSANKDGQKPLTESQAKGSLYLGQMRSATEQLEALSKVSPVATAATGSTFTNWATSAEAQKVSQAQNQWAEAYLRAKTGAAATESEVELNKRTFFPVVGDSKAVIEQKRRMRKQAEKDMEPVAGPGAVNAGGGGSKPSTNMPQGFRVIE